MATHFLHKFTHPDGTIASALANFNVASPDKPNAFALGVVSGAIYPGKDSSGNNQNLKLNTQGDNKPVLINSRDYTQATGDSIGLQLKPSQTVTSTGAVYGIQASPRAQDSVNVAAISAVQGAPILKGTSTVSGDVRAFEAAIDLNVATGSSTISGVVSALYAYLQVPSAGTYTGGCAVIHVPTSDQKDWDYFLKTTAAAPTFFNATAPTTLAKSLTVKIGSTLYYIALYSGVS
jgi:hypothetical protein